MTNRKERVPLGVPRLRLAVKSRPGFKGRWVNDVGDRINQALEGGYSFVQKGGAEFKEADTQNRNDSINDSVSKVVSSDGTKAFLMEIPTAMYNKDQKTKAERVNKIENGLRRGEDSHGKPGSDGRYIPKEGIKIS